MTTYKILFPTDFSPASHAALDVAAALARDRNATLIVAHCEEPPVAYAAGEFAYGVPIPNDEELQAMLDEVIRGVEGVSCEKRLLQGTPWRSIVSLAEKENVDLIVLGTHGRTGLMRVLMGSVAEAIVRHATCPVLSIRHGDEVPPHRNTKSKARNPKQIEFTKFN